MCYCDCEAEEGTADLVKEYAFGGSGAPLKISLREYTALRMEWSKDGLMVLGPYPKEPSSPR